MTHVFELQEVWAKGEYPYRDTWSFDLGTYSTLEKAIEAMQASIAHNKKNEEEDEQEEDCDDDGEEIFGYFIYEILLDTGWWAKDFCVRSYTRDGVLNDEGAKAYFEDETEITFDDSIKKLKHFYGRPEEKVRFKSGDVVEICYPGRQENELCIVYSGPITPQWVEGRILDCLQQAREKGWEDVLGSWYQREGNYKNLVPSSPEEFEKRILQRLERLRARNWEAEKLEEIGTVDFLERELFRFGGDSSDDCYLVYDEYGGHQHPHSPHVFAPTKEVSLEWKRKAQEKIEETIKEMMDLYHQ